MQTYSKAVEICYCGCPRKRGDKVVIEGGMVYCNFACHAKHEPHAHDFKPLAYEDRDVFLGANA